MKTLEELFIKEFEELKKANEELKAELDEKRKENEKLLDRKNQLEGFILEISPEKKDGYVVFDYRFIYKSNKYYDIAQEFATKIAELSKQESKGE